MAIRTMEARLKDILRRLTALERVIARIPRGKKINTGWVDLRPNLASGISYVADGAPELAGIKGRRIGDNVELTLGNFVIDAMEVGVSGNVSNRTILENLPIEFRPEVGVGIQAGWAGRVWSGYVHPNGSLIFGALVPNSTQGSTTTYDDQTYSGSAYYRGVPLP